MLSLAPKNTNMPAGNPTGIILNSIQGFNLKVNLIVTQATFEARFNVSLRITDTTKNKRLTALLATNMNLDSFICDHHIVAHT